MSNIISTRGNNKQIIAYVQRILFFPLDLLESGALENYLDPYTHRLSQVFATIGLESHLDTGILTQKQSVLELNRNSQTGTLQLNIFSDDARVHDKYETAFRNSLFNNEFFIAVKVNGLEGDDYYIFGNKGNNVIIENYNHQGNRTIIDFSFSLPPNTPFIASIPNSVLE